MKIAKILSVNYGIYNAIRMLIGVYHAAFLISTGISISQLAILQIVFSVTVLILDFPLSVFADRYYRKQMVVIGVFFTILFYPLCIFSPNITALVFSEIFYAIGICCISGAIEGWVLNTLDGDNDNFSLCAHLCERVASFGSVITGTIGISAVYFYDSYKSGYLISLVLMFFVLSVFMAINNGGNKNKYSERKKISIINQAKESVFLIVGNVNGKYFILISCFFTLGVQVIYHFWQPIMLSDKNIGSFSNDEIFTLLMCHIGAFSMQYVSNYLLPKFNVKSKMYGILVVLFPFISSGLCVLLFLFITNKQDILSIIIFSMIHGMISIIPVGAQNIFISNLECQNEKYISGALGVVSLLCRISSIIVLGGISLLPSNIPVVEYMFISAVAYILCGFSFLKWSVRTKDVIYDNQIQ